MDSNFKKQTSLLNKVKKVSQISGSSPPEIFVGKWNYPNIYTGILSPQEHGNTNLMSSPELWHKNKLQIPQILNLRKQLIYGRKQNHIKSLEKTFLPILQEVAMTHKSVSTEFTLKKPISPNQEHDSRVPLISRAGEIEKAILTENPKIKKKVDYLTSDIHTKSAPAILELDKSNISTESIIKILSAGLLGLKKNRKLVPTRWSITAVDDTLSKSKLERIRFFPQIQSYQVFSSEYLGNHYEFLLLPSPWSFEVLELSMSNFKMWHDYEGFFPRKKYADSVTGAYYANRLALTEHLEKIQKQSSCIVFREVRPEYYAPLGVGILRQTSREAFQNKPNSFDSLQQALADIQSRLRTPIKYFTDKSILLNSEKQTSLSNF